MSKSSFTRTLLLAGVVAFAGAGIAQAETFDSPQRAGEMSTMTQGRPNLSTNNIPNEGMDSSHSYSYSLVPDTTVLGAGPAVVTTQTYTYTYPSSVYVTPAPVMNSGWTHEGASETSNVPLRAGEVSTMTNGAPNRVTNNYAW